MNARVAAEIAFALGSEFIALCATLSETIKLHKLLEETWRTITERIRVRILPVPAPRRKVASIAALHAKEAGVRSKSIATAVTRRAEETSSSADYPWYRSMNSEASRGPVPSSSCLKKTNVVFQSWAFILLIHSRKSAVE